MKEPKSDKKGMDLIRLVCHNCGKRVKVPSKYAGKSGKCPKCRTTVPIPPLKKRSPKKSQERKKSQPADFDVPSLPELKQIELNQQPAASEGETIQVPHPKDQKDPHQGTAEELLVSSDGVSKYDVETVKSPGLDKADASANHPPASQEERTITLDVSDAIDDDIEEEDSEDVNDLFHRGNLPSELDETSVTEEEKAVPAQPEEEAIEQVEKTEVASYSSPKEFATSDHTTEKEEEHTGTVIEATEEEISPVESYDAEEVTEEEFGDFEEAEEAIDAEAFSHDFPHDAEEVVASQIEDQLAPEEAEQEDVVDVEDAISIGEEEEISGIENALPVEEVEAEELAEESPEEKTALQESKKSKRQVFEDLRTEKFTGGEMLQTAWEAFKNEDWETTLRSICQCMEQQQDTAAAHFMRALLYMHKQAWLLALEDLEKAEELGYDELAIETRSNQVHYLRAQQMAEAGAFPVALSCLDRIIGSNTQVEKGRIHWWYAQELYRQGAKESALAELDEAIFHNCLQPEVFAMRGQIYFEQRDYESAMHDFTAAINRGGENAVIFRARSETFYYLGNVDHALNDIRKAIEMEPEKAEFYDLQGLLLTEKGVFNEAESSFETSFGLDPGNIIRHYNRGLFYILKGRYDRAIDDFTKVLEKSPNDRMALLKRAICYQEKTNPNLAQAREDFKAAEKMERDHVYRSEGFNLVEIEFAK